MAKNGLDKWFKQKWVDIGSKKKGGGHKMWKKICEWIKKKVSKMRACCKSSKDDRRSEAECRCKEKRQPQGVGGKPTNVKTFARKKAFSGGYMGRSIRGEYGGVNLSNPSYVKYYKGMLD